MLKKRILSFLGAAAITAALTFTRRRLFLRRRAGGDLL